MFDLDGNVMPAERCLMADVLSGKISEALDVEVRMERPDRSRITVVVNIRPVKNPRGDVTGAINCFYDITERKRMEMELRQANDAKSRFLAAASHDLRQPLQALSLIQGLLESTVQGERAQKLTAQLDLTLTSMTTMLNTLLDINQIETGIVRAEMVNFPINDLLIRLRDEFSYHGRAKGIEVRAVLCSLSIYSDRHRLEQMLRNLISNALKYTRSGRVLLGCRRRKGVCRIEVWDTGVGIPEGEFQAIFQEFHQLDNVARERSRGLGLGLSIVQRLGNLLGHRVSVHSSVGKGSVFSIETTISQNETGGRSKTARHRMNKAKIETVRHTGAILVVEDDPELRELLGVFLMGEGHHTILVPDGAAALALADRGMLRPDLILADYNLPGGLNGIQTTAKLREKFQCEIPVVILTGDILADTLRAIALYNCVHLIKPVALKELTRVIERLLSIPYAGKTVLNEAD
jgi:two-component system CheB/CheR fusion protein